MSAAPARAAVTDTIVAIATAAGPAGVGILRVSGPDAFAIIDCLRLRGSRHASPTAQQTSHTLRQARLYEPSRNHRKGTGEAIDDALIAVFHAPHSFTGENVAEIQAHGGPIILKRLFAACLTAGARPARPGEFSERAFANNKVDLAQAEAIADLIAAETIAAQRAARQQATGALSANVRSIAQSLKNALAAIEASIDFPEEVGEVDRDVVGGYLIDSQTSVDSLLASANYGRRLRDGVRLVLTGRPNVGKSSLLNALTGTDRAIVTSIAGTTRDVIEESLEIDGMPVRAWDTAGIRETSDPVEKIGVERARRALADADAIVVVLDATAGLTAQDDDLLASVDGRAVVVAVNKSDVGDARVIQLIQAQASRTFPTVATAASQGAGIVALKQAIGHVLRGDSPSANNRGSLTLITSARHEAALRDARTMIVSAWATLGGALPAELIAVDVHGALQKLGEITGETAREDIIASIFAQFCIGK